LQNAASITSCKNKLLTVAFNEGAAQHFVQYGLHAHTSFLEIPLKAGILLLGCACKEESSSPATLSTSVCNIPPTPSQQTWHSIAHHPAPHYLE
jgi:hypothetical protein